MKSFGNANEMCIVKIHSYPEIFMKIWNFTMICSRLRTRICEFALWLFDWKSWRNFQMIYFVSLFYARSRLMNFVNSRLKYDKTKKWLFRKSISKFWTFFVSLKHNSDQTAKLSMKVALEWLFFHLIRKGTQLSALPNRLNI
jgi:hypothetical protein